LSRLVKIMPEIINIFWGTVSYRAFHVIPRILVGVKLRGISGEVVGMNTPVGFDEPLNRSGFMSGAPIPDKNKAPLEIFKEVPQKGIDLGMPDILGDMKTDVKTNSLSLGRDTDGRDRGYLRPSASHSKDRRLAARRPGFPDRWDKQKPALVEEDKGDFKPFGLFLYAAMNSVSIFLYSLIPFSGLCLGLLTAPTQILKDFPDMGGVILNVEALIYYLGDSLQSPKFGCVTLLQWPIYENLYKGALLSPG